MLIDTPGIFEPKRRLDRAMVDAAWSRAGDADIHLVIIDAAKGIDSDTDRIFARLKGGKTPRIAVLNKVDRIEDKARLLAFTTELTKRADFDRVFMISALNGTGVQDLKDYLAGNVPEGPWHYPEDEVSDLPLRMLAAEVTRERIYHWLHDELPYATLSRRRAGRQLKNRSVRIEQTIFVERESQRSIVLGKCGRYDQEDFDGSAKGDRRHCRSAGASVPVREGARELGQRSGTLFRDGSRLSQEAS